MKSHRKQKKIFYIATTSITLILISFIGYFISSSHRPNHIGFNWQKTELVYDLAFRSVIEQKDQVNKNMRRMVEVNADLHLKIYEIRKNYMKAAMRFKNPVIKTMRTRNTILENFFKQVFLVQITKEGYFEKFIFSNTVAYRDEKIITDILYNLQVILKSNEQYQTSEKDGNGEFIAIYNAKDNRLIKQKKEYNNTSEEIEIKNSNLVFEFDKTKIFFNRVQGDELLVFKNNHETYLKSSITIKAVQKKMTQSAFTSRYKFDQIEKTWLSSQKNRVSMIENQKQNKLKDKFAGRTFSQVADEQFKLYKTFDIRALRTLIEFLEYAPDSASEFTRYLIENKLNAAQRVTLVHALERNGSQKAQRALAEIMQYEALPHESRLQAAIAFSSVDEVADNSIEALKQSFYKRQNPDDTQVSSAALLTLGRIVANNNSTRSREIEDLISTEIEAVTAGSYDDVDRSVAALLAAGNTENIEYLDEIEQATENTQVKIRIAAVNALKSTAEAAADDMLVECLQQEEHPSVKEAVINVVTARNYHEESMAAVLKKVKTEDNDIVRALMYKLLLKFRDKPGIKDHIEELLESESSLAHRKILQTALYTKK